MSERGDSDLSLTPMAGQGDDRGSPEAARSRRLPEHREQMNRELSFVDAMPKRQDAHHEAPYDAASNPDWDPVAAIAAAASRGDHLRSRESRPPRAAPPAPPQRRNESPFNRGSNGDSDEVDSDEERDKVGGGPAIPVPNRDSSPYAHWEGGSPGPSVALEMAEKLAQSARFQGRAGDATVTLELAALMDRAKQLLGVGENSRSVALHNGYRPPDGVAASTNMSESKALLAKDQPPPQSGDIQLEDEVDEEALLDRHLQGAHGSLMAAYNALNDQYAHNHTAAIDPSATPKHGYANVAQYVAETRPLETLGAFDFDASASSEPLSDMGSGTVRERKARARGRIGTPRSDDSGSRPLLAVGDEPDERLRPARLLTASEAEKELATETKAKKRLRISPIPMFLYFFFLAAMGFYAFVRVTWGMEGLGGGLKGYSIFVLVVELLGAVNMLFYGCWLFAKPNNRDIYSQVDESGAELPLRRNYSVRVLVPCYKESLAIIQRTVLAARRADRPPGTTVTIYICDDGNDARKRNWVAKLNDPEILYVTGRDKSYRNLNGKSANLNHCLELLYPDVQDPTDESERMKIPVNELMCLFDADQTCSRGFFSVMLRYIDSGDDVGVALSPQLMYNVHPDCDIFNHQNVHFWEMMQPGMDALGFISLTGTNMILRSRALQGAGWFPMNSVTEDWALGMRFKKLKYVCRYVNQYLAIGEAPDITQQAFQQRSRWSKGHFQVFWSRECPLVDRRLNMFFRLAYSSTCIAYLSTGLSVIVLNLVPVLTILFGYFPIALNLYTVVAITAYYGALNALSYTSSSWAHYKALWLANTSSIILFYPYLKASFFTPIKQILGLTQEFKTTLKGKGAAGHAFKILAPSTIIVLINVAIFIVGAFSFRVYVNAAQAISMCWIVFNTIPHLTLLFNAFWGPGGFMVAWCRFAMFITAAAGALAIILMWLLWPREGEYVTSMRASITFLQTQYSGNPPGGAFPADIAWRQPAGAPMANAIVGELRGIKDPYSNRRIGAVRNVALDLSGGFYEDGIYGPVKLTKSNALSTAMLAWAILDAPDAFDEDPTLKLNTLNMIQHGVDYIKATFIQDPAKLGRPEGDVYVYMVGDVEKESTQWRRPEDLGTVPTYLTAGVANPTDLAGQMTAALVAGTIALSKNDVYDDAQRADALLIALRTYNVTMSTEGVVEHPRDLWQSNSFYDDRVWAATWMYRAALENALPDSNLLAPQYFADIRNNRQRAWAEQDSLIVSQDYILNAGLVHAALLTSTFEFHSEAQSFVWDWVCNGAMQYTPYGRAYIPGSPMLGDTVMAAALAQIYAVKTLNDKQVDRLIPHEFKRGFQCFAQQQARYLIGVGWQRNAYITGINDKGYDRLVHHGASCPAAPEPCPAGVEGNDAKDYNNLIGGLLWAPLPEDNPEDTRGANTTAVSLGNNVALPLLMAGMHKRNVNWLECLQDTGTLLKRPVCRQDRPVPQNQQLGSERELFWGAVFDPAITVPAVVNGTADANRQPPPPPPVVAAGGNATAGAVNGTAGNTTAPVPLSGAGAVPVNATAAANTTLPGTALPGATVNATAVPTPGTLTPAANTTAAAATPAAAAAAAPAAAAGLVPPPPAAAPTTAAAAPPTAAGVGTAPANATATTAAPAPPARTAAAGRRRLRGLQY